MRLSAEEARQVEKLRGHGFLTDWQHGYYDEKGQYHELPDTPANEFIKMKPQSKRFDGMKRFFHEIKYALYLDK